MIRTVLVDDEHDSIGVLKQLLNMHCPEVTIVGEAESLPAAVETIETTSPDLLLLDIAIAGENAFDLLNQLSPANHKVIFVTAWDTHAVQAFRYCAVDYLLKPVDGIELRRAVDKLQQPQPTEQTSMLEQLFSQISALQRQPQKIGIPTMTGLTFIFINDIMRLEAQGNCTVIFMSNGGRYMTTRTIREYETLLPENLFYRVHHSHIINLSRLDKYRKGRGGTVLLDDGSEVEVAMRRKDDFLRRILK